MVDFWMAEWGVYRYRCEIGTTTLGLARTGSAPAWMIGFARPGG